MPITPRFYKVSGYAYDDTPAEVNSWDVVELTV